MYNWCIRIFPKSLSRSGIVNMVVHMYVFLNCCLQNGNGCRCGHTYRNEHQNNRKCYSRCAGSNNQYCGGHGYNGVYQLITNGAADILHDF